MMLHTTQSVVATTDPLDPPELVLYVFLSPGFHRKCPAVGQGHLGPTIDGDKDRDIPVQVKAQPDDGRLISVGMIQRLSLLISELSLEGRAAGQQTKEQAQSDQKKFSHDTPLSRFGFTFGPHNGAREHHNIIH